jgi:hypothetical protein
MGDLSRGASNPLWYLIRRRGLGVQLDKITHSYITLTSPTTLYAFCTEYFELGNFLDLSDEMQTLLVRVRKYSDLPSVRRLLRS